MLQRQKVFRSCFILMVVGGKRSSEMFYQLLGSYNISQKLEVPLRKGEVDAL